MNSMIRPIHLLGLSLLGTSAASALVVALADAPTLSPEAGHSIRRAFTQTIELESSLIEQFQNGETREVDVTLTQVREERVEVVDTFLSVEDGQVMELSRTYLDTDVHTETTTDDDSTEEDEESELEEETVIFEWDADDEEWNVRLDDDSDADEDLLDELNFDMDFTFLLPEEEVEAGESWDVEPGLVRSMLSPAGDLQLTSDDAEEPDELQVATDDANDAIWDSMGGDATVTYVGDEDIDGVQIAVFTIEIDIEGEGEVAEEIEGPEGEDGERSVAMTFALEAEGELRWNLDAAHAQSHTLEGNLSISRSVSFVIEVSDGQIYEFGESIALEGTVTQLFEVEVADVDDDE